LRINAAVEQSARLSLKDALGRTILTKQIEILPGELDYQLRLNQILSPGIYLVTIQTSEESISKKLVIQ
jgi:hypothetical protein